MSNEYLWDRSGEPDPEIQRLEQLLGEFRGEETALRNYRRMRWSAMAAGVALAATATWLVSGGAPEGWRIARAGAPPARLAVGQVLETGPDGHATLNAGNVGTIDVEANSRLRLEREQRFSLEYGGIRAFTWSPPGTFVVDTPSAVATDLGCYYTLQVDRNGGGVLSVLAGWVSFERQGREAFIPAGAACRMRPGHGPGTPYREQASPAFRQALQDFDFAEGGDAALTIVLAQATKEDAFSLWHLLGNPRVYDALAALVPPPAGVTREGIQRHDRHMLDQWWDRLGLGKTGWWRKLVRVTYPE